MTRLRDRQTWLELYERRSLPDSRQASLLTDIQVFAECDDCHCEERSDEAISRRSQLTVLGGRAPLICLAKHGLPCGFAHHLTYSQTSGDCHGLLPRNDSHQVLFADLRSSARARTDIKRKFSRCFVTSLPQRNLISLNKLTIVIARSGATWQSPNQNEEIARLQGSSGTAC